MEKIYQLKISLLYSKPPIWRRVLIRQDMNFEDLHYLIQKVMDWDGSHLAEFSTQTFTIALDSEEDESMWIFGKPANLKYANKTLLSSILKNPKDKVSYIYDFGDSWEHDIVLEKVIDPDPDMLYPVCTDGKNSAPPENCGGIGVYYDYLEILNDKNNPEHEGIADWMGEDFDPSHFDIDSVNKSIRKIWKKPKAKTGKKKI